MSLLVDTALLDAAHVDVFDGIAELSAASLRIGDVTIANHPDLDPYRLAEALVGWGQAMQDALLDREGERAGAESDEIERGPFPLTYAEFCAAFEESLGDRETGR